MTSKHFSQFIYIYIYILFISYRMHLVELRCCKALHCNVSTTAIISSARAGQTAMQNINIYDWDYHIHNIIMRTLL